MTEMRDKIRILLADDHAVLRGGLRRMINEQPNLEVVGEASTVQETIRLVRELTPDQIILDLGMPEGNGLNAIPRIRKICPASRVIVLTMHDDPSYLRQVLVSGGMGYVLKRSADTDLLAAIRTVQSGHRFIDATMAESLLGFAESDRFEGEILSAREREVLKALAMGNSYQKVADRMCISVKTVESYRERISHKLGFRDRTQLVSYALAMGLLSVDGEES